MTFVRRHEKSLVFENRAIDLTSVAIIVAIWTCDARLVAIEVVSRKRLASVEIGTGSVKLVCSILDGHIDGRASSKTVLRVEAARLDLTRDVKTAYAEAVARAVHAVQHPDTLPSARVLAAIAHEHEHSFVRFIRSRSQQTQAHFLAAPLTSHQEAKYQAMTTASVTEQKAIEAADTLPFEAYRQQYVDPARLVATSIPDLHE